MISHLTFDELTEFASINGLNAGTEAKAAKVNRHLCECADCRDLAAAVMLINDAFAKEYSKNQKTKENKNC